MFRENVVYTSHVTTPNQASSLVSPKSSLSPTQTDQETEDLMDLEEMSRGQLIQEILALRQRLSEMATREAERQEGEGLYRQVGTHDWLTNLPNRLYFQEQLKEALLEAQPKNQAVAVFFLDLDDFKSINDAFGHEKGDALLQAVAERLSNQVQGNELVARIGGDEFAFIFGDWASTKGVNSVAEGILDAFTEPYDVEGLQVPITASMGISIYPEDGENAQALMKQADRAMYRAKLLGKDDYQFYNMALNPASKMR